MKDIQPPQKYFSPYDARYGIVTRCSRPMARGDCSTGARQQGNYRVVLSFTFLH
jgi:hypothetical protein